MTIDDLTISEAKKLAAMFANQGPANYTDNSGAHEKRPVVVCTDKRGVVFGYCQNVESRPITLTDARMCLYWSTDVGGVFGLGEKGPSATCKISAPLSEISLEGVTAIFSVDPAAEKAWKSAKVQGR